VPQRYPQGKLSPRKEEKPVRVNSGTAGQAFAPTVLGRFGSGEMGALKRAPETVPDRVFCGGRVCGGGLMNFVGSVPRNVADQSIGTTNHAITFKGHVGRSLKNSSKSRGGENPSQNHAREGNGGGIGDV